MSLKQTAPMLPIRTFDELLEYLQEQLDWPLPDDDLKVLSFPYSADELGIAPQDAVKIVTVKQLRPTRPAPPWGIFLVEFASKRLPVLALRRILRAFALRTRQSANAADRAAFRVEDMLFIAVHGAADARRLTFARFSGDQPQSARLSLFDWSPDEPCRTVCEYNLPALCWPESATDTRAWAEQWATAFDVERVTREFFAKYHELFTWTKEEITGLPDEDAEHQFTQALFNRLLFIAFIQKKRWLDGDPRYLFNRLTNLPDGENYYEDFLYWLFFWALPAAPEARDNPEVDAVARRLVGNVPFLNGGLFEPGDLDVRGRVKVGNHVFKRIFDELLDHYNFTITESTPLDIEVAVDPEMLGKVFEELVTGRHESGSYYTPKPVVAFMCREALKGHLEGAVEGETSEAVAAFVDTRDPKGLRNPEAVLEALKRVTVCDPACGSGAYLLGMMHELLELRDCLFAANSIDAITRHQRKLQIIESNLYGVDLQEFAVNIARLRLWLSLVVEYEGDNPPPLPNLDYKIETGDSLLGPNPEVPQQRGFRDKAVRDYAVAKARYMNAHGADDKSVARREAEALRAQVVEWTHPNQAVTGFDWPVEFAEVFANSGFDIVVANPPYVRQEIIRELKPALKAGFPAVYCGTADLYCYFYARALQVLRPAGMLAFISSNKWLRAGYGAKLRGHIAETTRVLSITDFGSLPVFQSALAYPMVFVAGKAQHGDAETTWTEVQSLEPPYPDVLAVVAAYGQMLPASALAGSDWRVVGAHVSDHLETMSRSGPPLGEYIGSALYRGIITGLNKAFFIDGATRRRLIAADPRSAEVIVPLVLGRDIRKWAVDDEDRWLILTRIGTDIGRYPAVFAHLQQWQAELEPRYDQGNHWWELRACDYYDALAKPKIIYQEIATYQAFAYEATGAYVNNKVFSVPLDDMYLLGVLNSAAAWEYLNHTCAKLQGGAYAMQTPYLSKLPIPSAGARDRKAVETLVRKCLKARGEGCEEWEREINERVEALYGL